MTMPSPRSRRPRRRYCSPCMSSIIENPGFAVEATALAASAQQALPIALMVPAVGHNLRLRHAARGGGGTT